MGTRKLSFLIKPMLAQIGLEMGRDALFAVLADNGLLVRKRRRRAPITTNSYMWRRQFPDLLNTPSRPKDLAFWVADITYLRIRQGFVFLALITDLDSRRIVGYNVSAHMDTASLCLPALLKALQQITSEEKAHLVHHSDRGSQYLDSMYVELLRDNQVMISATQTGDPQDNAVAERVNGILKHEYLTGIIDNLKVARKLVAESVEKYNEERPHLSLNYQTPNEKWLQIRENMVN